MKKILLLLVMSIFTASFSQNKLKAPNGVQTIGIFPYSVFDAPPANGGVGINTTTPQGILDVNSTTDGILIPRMTNTQMNNISLLVTSKLVWNITMNSFYYYDGSGWVALGGGSGGVLAQVDQGNGVGIIIADRDEAFFGNVGFGAVDLSFNNSDIGGPTDSGATGLYSNALGAGNKSSGDFSTSFGLLNTASGEVSTVFGVGNTTNGYVSTALGQGNTAEGNAETAIGYGGTAYTPTDPNIPERLFNVGNGDGVTPSDAFQVWYNGLAYLPTATNAEITAATDDVIPTKGWVIANAGGGATNLTYTASATNGIVNSDTGTDATIPLADGTNAGLLKPADFTKLGTQSGTNTGDNSVNTNSNAYADGKVQNSLTASTTLAPSVTAVNTGLSAIQAQLNNTVQTFYRDIAVTSAVTSTIMETLLYTIPIPANTFATGSEFEVAAFLKKVGINGTFNFRLYHNTSNTLTGASSIGNYSGSSNRLGNPYRRKLYIGSGTCWLNASGTIDNYVDSAIAPYSFSFNTANINYFFLTIQPNSGSDSFTGERLIITGVK